VNKKFGIAAVAAASLALTACSGGGAGSGGSDAGNADPSDLSVGVALPTQTTERWITDGANVQSQLEDLGYGVQLQYANDDVPTQQQQVDQMITGGADLLIIAPVDGTSLTAQLEAAAAASIPVIAYDRLIRDTENVDFYVTFDNFQVGVTQAEEMLMGLGLLNRDGSTGTATGPFNVELFAGSLDDNNATFVWDGAMSVLQPLMDDGTLIIPSGQTTIEQCATDKWSQENAQRRMDNLLTDAYSDGTRLDGILTPYDGMTRGVITSLSNAGYTTLGAPDKPMPVTEGQDAEIASVKLIAENVQYATIFKDTRILSQRAVGAAQSLLEGEEPEANDTESYDNGQKVVPSYLEDINPVFADNIESVLVDTDYYTAAEIEAGQTD